MPTFEIRAADHQILLRVNVSIPPADDGAEFASGTFDALVDTGAQRTFVSSNVVEQISAIPIDIASFVPANGQSQETEVFRLLISIPYPQDGQSSMTFMTGSEFSVMRLPFRPHNFDVLLGMDFLSQFHISMFGGRIVLSN